MRSIQRMIDADSHTLREAFASNLRIIRRKSGLSQEALADVAGLHRTYIGSVERAETNISIDNIEKIVRALKIQPEQLFAGWQS